MATATEPKTLEDLLAMEARGIDCEIIRGELRIRGAPQDERPMTTRGYPHSRVLMRFGYLLGTWLDRQPPPRGVLVGGEVRVRLRSDPETFVGIDLAYISAELAARTEKNATFIDGPPILAIEIISPTDTAEGMAEKVGEYLDAGVPLVWEVNPFYEIITVHRPGAPAESFNVTHDLTAEPHLPGFRAPVAAIFAS
jgi:Uma2 family endonuclease